MALLSLQDVSISFGGSPVLDKVSMQVEKGERVCLLGRNGEGKTTLLKLISGEIKPDSGTIALQKGSSIAGLSQELPAELTGSVYDVVATGLGEIGVLLEEYRHLTMRLSQGADHSVLKRMNVLQDQLEREKVWQVRQRVESVLSRLAVEPDVRVETLSVGIRRRVLLARALVAEPEILLLDEPTNHLDINSINWMEEFLEKYRGTLLFVTHDRMFLQRLATRIVEIDRGRLFSADCGYRIFLERRKAVLEAEDAQRGGFMRKLAKEETWIRKGVKARRTRNEGRVQALIKMREEQQSWRMRAGSVKIRIPEAETTGNLVIEAIGVSHGFGEKTLIKDFSVKILRGDRIGIIGPNGIGKSTLLRILLGEIVPNQGKIRTGTRLEIVYFDQLREQLDGDKTVQDNVADGKDVIDINGSQRHVLGYLKEFLFSPDQAKSPARILSGGERNRLLLARLFARPCNVLVLDEPTNDLDIETLELFEERLLDYSGTILLVSHDREFLNNVVTSTLVFEPDGAIREYAGGYDDWLSQRVLPITKKKAVKERPAEKVRIKKERPRKLTFREGKELEALTGRIELLEQEQKELYKQLGDPGFYKGGGDRVAPARIRVDTLQRELDEAYARWEELESIHHEDTKI
jgi:ATP-binding cassette subfamily F protein uup